jgi:carbon monoxide dehydrogenase subunit G
MELEHRFRVPAPMERAWLVLNDVERVAPCLPGAALESVDGDVFTGTVKIKLGPVTMVYAGTATFAERDAVERRVVMHADARAARGGGTARAVVHARLTEEAPDSTRVDVTTDLTITGKPAQFGRALIVDVGNAFFEQFSTRLAAEMVGPPAGAEAASAAPADAAPSVPGAPPAAAPPRPAVPAAPESADLLALLRSMVRARVARLRATLRDRFAKRGKAA